MTLIHATCVTVSDVGVLIRGPSGSGKSDLALRLIDEGAALVCDDYGQAAAVDNALEVGAPEKIAGKMEVRGYGIITLPHQPTTRIGLVVDLMPTAEIPRLPDDTTCVIEGVTLPRLMLDPFTASATAKVRVAAWAAHNTEAEQ
jgi:HPr kinase/phosphorylase